MSLPEYLVSKGRMTIVTIPGCNFHPYLQIFSSHLRKYGVVIENVNFAKFPLCIDIFKLIMLRRKTSIINLHWIDLFFVSGNAVLSAILSCLTLLLLLFLRILRFQIVVTLHNVRPHKDVLGSFALKIFKSFLNEAEIIIVHNEYSKNLACELYALEPTKFVLVKHGHWIRYYPNEMSKQEARRRLGISASSRVFLFFGGIGQYKGVGKLLQAFQLLSEDQDSILLIAGRCLDKKLERLIKIRYGLARRIIVKLGYIKEDAVQVFMNAADVGVIPYEEVYTPGSLLLFMSFGRPIITTNLDVVKEYVLPDWSILVPPTVSGLMFALKNCERIIGHEKEILEYTKLYDWQNSAEKFLQVCEKLVQN